MAIRPATLFNLAKPVDKEHAKLNKYTYLAYTYGFKHYRILSLRDIMLNKLQSELPKRTLDFIAEHGEVLLIGNMINSFIPLVQLRNLRGDKSFDCVGNQRSLFYSQGYLPHTFKYGDPIIVVEGSIDADILRGLYPNILATMTSKITRSQLETLKYMTNKIILCGDADKPGRIGTKHNAKKLKEVGIQVKYLFQYGDYKDAGDMAESLFQGDYYTFNLAVKYYKTKIDDLLRGWL